jgi:hypothetical protein
VAAASIVTVTTRPSLSASSKPEPSDESSELYPEAAGTFGAAAVSRGRYRARTNRDRDVLLSDVDVVSRQVLTLAASWPNEGECQGLSDGSAGQHHDQPVNPDAEAACGWHGVFEG